MCRVFQDGGHANRNRDYILFLGRKYEEFFVVLLSFLYNAIYSINYIRALSSHTVLRNPCPTHYKQTIEIQNIFAIKLLRKYKPKQYSIFAQSYKATAFLCNNN